jgi:hypothetical protein
LIHKVNRPTHLSVVSQPKKMENDPGGSQGGGNFYEGSRDSHSENEKSKKSPKPKSEETAPPELALVVNLEHMGMTEVMTDFMEHKKNDVQVVNPGLSVRYTSDSQPAKGLLLNKKAE